VRRAGEALMARRVADISRLATVLVMAVMAGALAACTTHVQSGMTAPYDGQPQRLFVATFFLPHSSFSPADFERQLTAALSACAIMSEVAHIPTRPLTSIELDTDQDVAARNTALDRLMAFEADAQLLVQQIGAGIDTPITMVFRGTYHVSLQDIASDTIVWQADISTAVANAEAVSRLVREIVGRLSQDGILRSCPVARKAASLQPRIRS
jgi:hypothetical protein